MKMASVKEMVNSSLGNAVYSEISNNHNHWHNLLEENLKKENEVSEIKERTVTFIDNIGNFDNSARTHSDDLNSKQSSTNYK